MTETLKDLALALIAYKAIDAVLAVITILVIYKIRNHNFKS